MQVLQGNSFQSKQLGYLKEQIERGVQGWEYFFWDAIRALVHAGLWSGSIDYVNRYQSDLGVWYTVPTKHLYRFYQEGLLEGLPNLPPKTFTRRLLCNTNYIRKKIRYQGRVTPAVVWGTNQAFYDWLWHEWESR